MKEWKEGHKIEHLWNLFLLKLNFWKHHTNHMPRQKNNNTNKKDNKKTQLQKTKKKPNQNKNMNSMNTLK
jgi:hypothetical protein